MDGGLIVNEEGIKSAFAADGYAVVPGLLTGRQLGLAARLSRDLIERYRAGERLVTRDAISVADVTLRHPERNPGVDAARWEAEPFIIGDLVARDVRFAQVIALPSLWKCTSFLLGCSLQDVVFHHSNLTRKPAGVGPAIGWHRDASNTYFSTTDDKTVRFLLPLQLMSEDNGGTALIPGSHEAPQGCSSTDAIFPRVSPGSGLALHSQILHGGYPNRGSENRDVIVLQFGVASSTLAYQGNEILSLCHYSEIRNFCIRRWGNDCFTDYEEG